MQVCTRCVMDTSAKEIIFDSAGVCNFCQEAEAKLKKGWFPNEEGKKKIEEIASKIREYGQKYDYDCIIGMSGGVDSSYLLHLAVVEMKLRPLIVHVDAGWNSEIAVKNIENMVKKLNLDLYTYVVDWEEMKDVQLAFLKASVANQDVPQDYAFFSFLYKYAVKNKVKYVVTGSNLSSESILPESWGYKANDTIHLKSIHKKFGKMQLKSYPLMSYFKNKIYWRYIKKMQVVKPLNFIDYDKNKAITFLEENYGWRYYGGKHHESRWTKFFQAYYLPEKFGYDKRKAHLSSMIVSGQISRDEALEELGKPLYNDTELAEDKLFIAKKLGLSYDQFEQIINLPKKTYEDYGNEEKIDRLFKKIKRTLGK